MFRFGVDYYPEHWPEERWATDARLMRDAGINTVRLAEFAWSELEPEDGVFDFEWLDRAIRVLVEHGIEIILGTPTASPPAWLMTKHSDAFLVDENGLRRTYGNRREYCPTNRAYLEHALRIVGEMTGHYAGREEVFAWQIDNEFGDRCYCPSCLGAFREWLKEKYGTLDEVNSAWGTVFWGHTYTGWDQIPTPMLTGGVPNPGLALDYRRFCSNVYVRFQRRQVDAIREECPEVLITHNMMGFPYDKIDYFDLAQDVDVVSWDNYQRNQFHGLRAEADWGASALSNDAMRGLKRKNIWVIEQQAGPAGWDIVGGAPRPGELRLWAYQAIAHGADAILFFRWRTARWGTEEYWHGVLDHHGIPGRRYEEIRKMGRELQAIGDEILGSTSDADVAILSSYDARFAFQIQRSNPRFSYERYLASWYRAFHRRNVSIDVVRPEDGLDGYKLIIAPALHLVTEDVAQRLDEFVKSGGILVTTARSGVKDETNAVVDVPLPGLLRELCGIRVAEYDSLAPDMTNAVRIDDRTISEREKLLVDCWCDVLALEKASAVGAYTDDYYAGQPAISINSFGSGRAIYVGAIGSDDVPEALADWLLRLAQVSSVAAPVPGVEIVTRARGDQRLLFALNHTRDPQEITLRGAYDDLIGRDGLSDGSPVAIPPLDVRILSGKRS
jgi:beta-galactosidase